MKKRIISLLLSALAVYSLFTFPAMAQDGGENAGKFYYVAPNGDDRNPGTIDAPFATVDRARDAIRELKKTSGLPNGGVTVYLREGIYSRDTSLEFTEEDSGEEGKRITYSSYPGEKVEITGGKYINGSDFKKVTDKKLLNRLDPEVRGKLVSVNLKDYGITNYGTWTSKGNTFEPWALAGETDRDAVPGLMVFVNDDALDIARVPNRVDHGENKGMWDYFEVGSVVSKTTGNYGCTFGYTDDRIEKWESYKDVAVYGFWTTSWIFETSAIQSVDFSKKQITLQYPLHNDADVGRRYIYLNVFEELDSESEYFIDKYTMNLYMLRSDKLSNARVGVTNFGTHIDDHLVYLNGASNITIRGLNVTLARTNGIVIKHGYNNLIDNCEIKNLGGVAVGLGAWTYHTRFNGTRGLGTIYGTAYTNYAFEPISREDYLNEWQTANNGLTNSVIKNTGSYGIFAAGGDILEVEPANNYVDNCDISYTGTYKTVSTVAVDISGVGTRVSHCDIHDNQGAAALFNGMDMIIEYNDMYRNCIDSSDFGVMYSCGWVNEMNLGTEIRYNIIRDVVNKNFPGDHISAENGVAPLHAIYNDNGQPFLEVHHNIIVNVPTGVLMGGCDYNNWKNNIFIDVLIPIENIGLNGIYERMKQGYNCFYWLGYTGLDDPKFKDNKKFLEKYPQYTELRNKMLSIGMAAFQPIQNISDNVMVFYNCPERYTTEFLKQTIYTPQLSDEYSTYENNYSTTEDIGFYDIANGDYRIKENAEILKTHPGLASIDSTKIGYQKHRTAEIFDNSVTLKIGSETAYSFGNYSLIDNENAEVTPIVKDSRTLVPVRFISEALGCKVDWDSDTKTVTVNKDGKNVILKIGSEDMTVGSETKKLDVPADIINGRTMVPLRAIAEALNQNVTYDESGLIIITGLTVDKEADKDSIAKISEYSF